MMEGYWDGGGGYLGQWLFIISVQQHISPTYVTCKEQLYTIKRTSDIHLKAKREAKFYTENFKDILSLFPLHSPALLPRI